MSETARLQRALEFLIEQNTVLHRRLALAGVGNLEEACQAAAVVALLAVATAEGLSVDLLPDEHLERILAQVESVLSWE